MLSPFKSLLHSGFLRNMSFVAGGTMVAQIAMVISAPLLTAVFPPAAFGAFAAVQAASNILVTFVSLRLDVLIPFARRQSDVAGFIQVVILGPLSAALLIACILMTLPPTALTWLGLDNTTGTASLLIPFAAISIACMAAMRGLAVRQGRFSMIGTAQIVRVITLIAASYSMGVLGWTEFGLGLIAGQALGDLIFAVIIWRAISSRHKLRLLSFHPRRILASIRSEASAIKTLSSTQAMAILYERSPPLVILTAFGPVEAGFYALAVRIAQAPATLVAKAFDDVFRQRAARSWAKGQRFTGLMRNGLIITMTASIIPMSLAILATPSLVGPIFGQDWNDASTSIVILLGVAIFAFNSKAFDKVPIMLKAHRYIFAWHSARMFVEVGAGVLAVGGLIGYETWLQIVASGRAGLYIVNLVASFVLARVAPLVHEKGGR